MHDTFNVSPLKRSISLALATLTLALPQMAGAAESKTGEVLELAEVQVNATKDRPEGSADSGYRNRSVSLGVLGQRKLQDTPYSINVTSGELIDNLQAMSSTDALKYLPAVNPEMGSNHTADYFSVRGFINSANQAIDGMRSELNYGVLEDKERIEVLSGATSFLYGMASPAGMINYVLKRPTSERLLKVRLGSYGGSQAYAHVDAGGPLDAAGRFAYRVNAVASPRSGTNIDQEHRQRDLFSTSGDWRLSPDTLLSFDVSRLHDRLDYAQAYFLVGASTSIPGAPDAARNYSAPYSYTERAYSTYGFKLNSAINSVLSLRSTFRQGRSELEYMGVRNNWVNNAGDYNQQMMYYRAPQITDTSQGNLFADLAFSTGGITHRASIGYAVDHIELDSAGTSTYNFPAAYVIGKDKPVYQPKPAVSTANQTFAAQDTWRKTLFVADEIQFAQRWSLLAGAAQTSLRDRNYSTTTGTLSADYNEQKTTPSVALMYKPQDNLSTYLSYIEALEKGSTAPTTAVNANQVLKPFLSTQYELGAKLSLADIDLNAALFRIEKASAYSDPVSKIYSDDGRQVHTGGEFSFSGKFSERLTLLGGFSILDARLDKTSNAIMLGKSPQAVPERLARLYGEYALASLAGLTLTGGVSYTDSMWADDANTLKMPSVVLGEVGVRYETLLAGRKATLRLNVSNVADKNYWTSKGGGMLYLGSPRTVAVSTTMEL